MKNILFIFAICFFVSGCTRMTIPVNVLPFLLIHENQLQQAKQLEKLAIEQTIQHEKLFAYVPQQRMLSVDPFREETR